VSPGGADLTYRTAKYAAAALYKGPPPFLEQSVILARQRLAQFFTDTLSLDLLGERLLSLKALSEARLDRVRAQKLIVEANIATIADTSRICYDSPKDCPQAVSSIKLSRVDVSAFELPSISKGSFRLYSTSRGVFSRQDSITTMAAQNDVFPEIRALRKDGNEFSIVLDIEGIGLKEASLYFEDRKLSTLDLKRIAGFPGKSSGEHTFVILYTTRDYSGWLDIDLPRIRNHLARELPKADGVFYFDIFDEFGRHSRIDISYEKWSSVDAANKDGTQTTRSFQAWNNWWETGSDGTNATARTTQTRHTSWTTTTKRPTRSWDTHNVGPVSIPLGFGSDWTCENIVASGLWTEHVPNPEHIKCAEYPGLLSISPNNVAQSSDYDAPAPNYGDNRGTCTYTFECVHQD